LFVNSLTDLKHPSKAIPKGTLYGLALTFVAYTLVILAMAGTITRASFLRNVNVIQDVNLSGSLVLAGEFASTFFSTLMGVIGSAKLLQALARDKLLPGFTIFGQGTKKGDEPTYAIIATYLVAQVVMLCDINQIASFVTMTYLMTFLVMNLATFLLKIGSAPNFRPSFHFFSWQTALAGTIVSGAAMFFVDGVYATGCVAILIIIFLLIHYTTPPRSWGDVSQSLIYHQVRKYLLRLRQEHVKFWRPQILLFVNDPRRQYKLIQFCNSMKKGSLYILGKLVLVLTLSSQALTRSGHVIVSQDFGASVPEARRQQAAWTRYIDFSKVKAFVNIAISPGVEWGARNIVLGAGLGGMRPNIAVLGFYNMDDLRHSKPLIDVSDISQPSSNFSSSAAEGEGEASKDKRVEELPTDSCKTETMMSVTSYVTILEDLLLRLQINVAVARGFQNLEFPHPGENSNKRYLDLWPIQMSAEISSEGDDKANVLTTNFDTCKFDHFLAPGYHISIQYSGIILTLM
jgi:potassium/chloride transporter 9